MRSLTKTGIRILSAKYRSILIKCAILNAMVLMFGASPSFAADVNTWSGLKDAVAGSTEQINVTGDITRGASDGDITISRTLSIVGTETSRYLSGNGAYAGLAIVAGGNLTLTNINMQNFKIVGSNESGGAIYNFAASGNSSVESITGNFTSNSISGYAGTGGAIYNYAYDSNANIGNIIGDFTSNSASLDNYGGAGGAIYNYAFDSNANIGNITGNFTSNSVGSGGAGGAIYNFATLSKIGSIGNITGDFISNSAGSSGGAIHNYARGGGQATLSILATNNKDVTFNGNFVTSSSGKGGAIYNHSEDAIATIGLYADTNRTITFVGGADETGKYDIDGIYNDSTLNINGNSTDRYTGTVNLYKVSDADPTDPTEFQGTTNIYDGTVNVKDTLAQKTLNLIGGTLNLGRNAEVYDFNVTDGAKLSLSIPDGTFENYENVINTLDVSNDFSGVLSNLTVDYDATAAEGSNMDKIIINGAGSGSVAPNSSIKLTSVNVIKDGNTLNNGIFLTGTPAGTLDNLDDVTETITSTTTSGGFKYIFTPSAKGVVSVTREVGKTLAGEIQDPNGSDTFSVNTNPYMTGEDLGSLAGENRNFTINGNGNTIDGTNPASGKFNGITVGNSSGQEFTLENATMQNFTTAITNKIGATTNINGVTFANNDTDIANNGTLKLSGTNSISTITGIGATNIESGVVNANANIEQNIINVNSGATLASNTAGVEIKADGTDGNLINDGTINITGANSRFGADHLTNDGTINITGANSLLVTSTLTNNGTIDTVNLVSNSLNNNGNITTSGAIEAIIQNNEGGSITFNNHEILMVNLTNSGTVNFNGYLNYPDSNVSITQKAGTINFSNMAATEGNPIKVFTMNGGSVNIADEDAYNILHINQLNLTGNIDFTIDADLENEISDRIKIHDIDNSEIASDKTITIKGINLLSDATQDKINISLFADDATRDVLKNNVRSNIKGLTYSSIYKYDALYDSATGMIGFTRYNSGTSDDFNPYLYAPSVVANTTAAMTTQIATLAMDKMDDVVHVQGRSGGDTTKSSNAWVKVMGLNDNVEFNNFENIDSKALTVAAGYNTDKITWADNSVVFGAYAGYIGGKQHYTGNDAHQDGGYVGLSSALTLGDAFLTATVNGGLLKNKANNMYGSDRFNTLWLGAGLKTGYNFAITDSVILQPNVYGGYTLVNTQDYTSVSGVKIATNNLNFFEIDPGLKLSAVIADGWTGSVQGKYAIVMDNGADITANDFALQNISTKNYIEYGIGIDKSVTDAFYLGAQINRHDGGRTGWNGSIEFRYKF